MIKKKIDFYCATFLTGGIETTLLQILNHIDKNKFSVRLVIMFHTVNQEALLHQVHDDVEVKYLVKSKVLNYFRSKRLIKKLPLGYKLIEEFLFVNLRKLIYYFTIRKAIKASDIVVDYSMCLMKQTKLLKNSKSVIYCHFSLNHLDRNNTTRNFKRVQELDAYDKVITICDEMKSQFISYHPNSKNKVERIYNYMDQNYVLKRSEESSPEPDSMQNYILAIGRLDESQKDYTTLLNAYAIAKKQFGIQEKLIILGKGRDEYYLKQLSFDLGISNDVEFKGFETNPYKWIKNCTLFIHSSKFEGLPTVIIEALILKKIVVATLCETGVKELLGNGNAGLLCDVGNVNQMAEKISEAIINTEAHSQYINNSQEFLQEVTISKTIQRFESILNDI